MKLVLSILSARNKQNGKYLLCKDGNMHSMLNRLLFMAELNGCTIGLPHPSLIDDLDEWQQIISKLPCNISFKFGLPYGRTIDETRQHFQWTEPCFASSIPGTKAKHYFCNTFVLPDIDQPCDAYVYLDLRSMQWAETIWVYSKEQTQLMPFKHKLKIDTNVCHPLYYWAVDPILPFSDLRFTKYDLLVPFNLNDSSYDISGLLNWQGLLVILNPRQNVLPNWLNEGANLLIKPLSKAHFYGLLTQMKSVYLPVKPGIFHILQSELAYFGFLHNEKTNIWSKP